MKRAKSKEQRANNARNKTAPVVVALCSLLFALCFSSAESAAYAPNNLVSPANYNTMQPFLNNRMRDALRPSANNGAQTRRVVSRAATPARNSASSAAASPIPASGRRVVQRAGTARSATNVGGAAAAPGGGQPQAAPKARNVVARSGRGDSAIANQNRSASTIQVSGEGGVSTSRCLADYRECMNGYCRRDNAPYNRCFCSPQLAQIEATLRPAIDDILQRLLILKNGAGSAAGMTDAELEEFWNETFGPHYDRNHMADLNEALKIDWPDAENRMRGQNAFVMGHDYCIQHLRGCFYMASNLRDAYRSEIARDCQTYEKYLQNIKTAGESILSQTGN